LQVNEYQQTSIDGVYAIGDVCGGGLAHVAAQQGMIAAEKIAGLTPAPYHPMIVPRCTYTHPEIASVGYTEEKAREEGLTVQTGKFPLRAIGKSLIYGEIDGMVKIVSDATTGAVLGVHLIGAHATDMIGEPGVILAGGLSVPEWLRSVHAHPTISEVFHEALLAVEGRAIHL
jgi:dihydrolipoamide dehydrogenase